MTTPKTSTDLANRALEKLLVVGAGQAPEAEDTQRVLGFLPGIFETLAGSGVYNVVDPADIDLPAFEWLAVVVAYYVAADFGRASDPAQLEYAESRLRKLNAGRPTYQVLQVEYF